MRTFLVALTLTTISPWAFPAALAQTEFQQTGSMSPRFVRYGSGREERIAVYTARGNRPAPILLYFSGNDWPGPPHPERLDKLLQRLRDEGFAVVEVRYPSTIDAEFDRKLAAQIDALRLQEGKLKLDFGRVALWGRGTGAFYAALFGADPDRARVVGLDPSALKCVLTLNGESFDIKAAIAAASPRRAAVLKRVLPEDDGRSNSPIVLAAPPNVAAFLMLSDAAHAWSARESQLFSTELRRQGTDAHFERIPVHDNTSDDLYLGTSSNMTATNIVRFLSKHLHF